MKKLFLFFIILLGFFSWPSFSLAGIVNLTGSGFVEAGGELGGPGPDDRNECGLTDYCSCQLNYVGKNYFGKFRNDTKLYNGNVLVGFGDNAEIVNYSVFLKMINNQCDLSKEILNNNRRNTAEPVVLYPTCEYRVGTGSGCCCTRDDQDGSVDCTVKTKEYIFGSGSCQLMCGEGQFAYDTVEGNCSVYEKEAITSAATLAIGDLKNLQSKAQSLNKLFNGKFSGIAGVNTFIGKIILFLMGIIGSLLLLFYVYAGILWMTAQGNSEQITKAKHILLWATLGFIFNVSGYFLLKALFTLFT